MSQNSGKETFLRAPVLDKENVHLETPAVLTFRQGFEGQEIGLLLQLLSALDIHWEYPQINSCLLDVSSRTWESPVQNA